LIVVDTNIIAYLLIQGERTPLTRKLVSHDPQWVAPSFWRIEFLNVLMNYSRHLKMPPDDLRRIWDSSFQVPHLREEGVEPQQALDAAIAYKISGYDALFLALAQNLKTVCITQDKALRKAAPRLTASLEEFLE
jgi:predicted nucleic acid-binding protein